MKTLFKKAFELSSEDDTEVYLVAFRRGRFHEFNSLPNGANRVLFPPAPSVVVRAKHDPTPRRVHRLIYPQSRQFPTTIVSPATLGKMDGGRKEEHGQSVPGDEGREDCTAGDWDEPDVDEEAPSPHYLI